MGFPFCSGGSISANRKLWAAGSIGLLLAAGLGWLLGHSPAPTLIACLSVGQGDCAVVTSEGWTVLIDAGPLQGKFDAAERLALPALNRLGVDGVDLVLLSHPDLDHVGGIGTIHRKFPSARFAVSAEFRSYPTMLQRLREAEIDPKDVIWTTSDFQLKVGKFTLRGWCPSMAGHEIDNDGSMFVRVQDGRATAVFSGDAPSEAEAEALKHGDWSAQVMKAGHHGSRTATSEAWLRAVRPQVAVLSCGRNNRYGHPHREVVDRIQAAGVEVWRTDRQGDAVFDVGPNGFVLRR